MPKYDPATMTVRQLVDWMEARHHFVHAEPPAGPYRDQWLGELRSKVSALLERAAKPSPITANRSRAIELPNNEPVPAITPPVTIAKPSKPRRRRAAKKRRHVEEVPAFVDDSEGRTM